MAYAKTDNWLEIDETAERYAGDLSADSVESATLVAKKIEQYQQYSRFWKSRISLGRKCMRYMKRDIFTAEQRAYYEEVLLKIPVEPQELKDLIDSLMFMIGRRINPGTVTMEDDTPPPTAAKPEDVATVLRWVQKRLKMDYVQRDVLRTGLCVGFPQALWFDIVTGEDGLSTDLQATLLPWETTLPSPHFRQPDGSDIEDVIHVDMRTRRQMLDMFPEREKDLDKHENMLREDPNHYISILRNSNKQVASDRADYLANMVMSSRYDSLNGHYFVIQHTFPVKKKRDVWYSETVNDFVEIPEDWPEWRRDAWKQSHPEYDEHITREMKTLWQTIVDTSGFVWHNEQHGYQNRGALPCAWFIADMVDRIPTGAAEDCLPGIFTIAVSDTEGLDAVRKGTGTVTFVEEGKVRHPKTLGNQLNSANGVVLLKALGSAQRVGDVVTWRDRKPNTTFLEFADRQRAQLREVHHINEAVMGAYGGRQSYKAKQSEIDQSMAPQAAYVSNFAQFTYNVNTLICNLFPYFLTEQTIVQIDDEFGGGQQVQVQVNAKGWDAQGAAAIIANDLTSARYRYVPKPDDDNAVSRESQMREFVEMLSAFGNTLLQLNPQYMANFLMNLPNRYARQCGKFMNDAAQQQSAAQQQQAAADGQKEQLKQQTRTVIELMKTLAPRLMMKTDASDIAAAPEGFQVFYQMFLAQQQQAQQIAEKSLAMIGTPAAKQQPGQPGEQAPEQGGMPPQLQAMMGQPVVGGG